MGGPQWPALPAAGGAQAADASYQPYEPWRLDRPQRRGRRPAARPLLVGAAALAAVAVVAAVAVTVLRGGDSAPQAAADAVPAGGLFASNPRASFDGRTQHLTDVAAVGSTVVAVGDDAGAGGSHGRFLVSVDSGRTFQVAGVRPPAGQANAPGDVPRLVAASTSGWVAFGRRPAGGILWTSRDGRSWERLPYTAASAFQRQDRVQRIQAGGPGFIAVGSTSAKGDFTDAEPVVWLSPDGRGWERLTGDSLGIDAGKASLTLMNAASDGRTLLVEGKRVVNAGRSGARSSGAVWSSGDGGRTWKIARVPAPKGSVGLSIGGGPKGLLAVREIRDGDERHAQIYSSGDGSSWSEAGTIETSGYQRTAWLLPAAQSHVAIVLAEAKAVLLTSPDGADWQETGTISLTARQQPLGAATTGGGTFVVGTDRTGDDSDAFLSTHGGAGGERPIDLSRVPGAFPPDRSVSTVTAGGGGLAVAVGGTDGDAAAWTSIDGGTWLRAALPTDLTSRAQGQQLTAVTHGARGWLAVGIGGTRPRVPLVVSSANGTVWQEIEDDAFKPDDESLTTGAAASAGPGYAIVGTDGDSAAVWFSADLKTWERGQGADDHDLKADGDAARWMRSVVGGPFGFAAGGGVFKGEEGRLRRAPAAWSSADGRNWVLRELPLPRGFADGTVERVVAAGQRLVAVGEGFVPGKGVAPLAFVSPDGGQTWRAVAPPIPPGGVDVRPTAVLAHARGFLATGVTGRPGGTDVVTWTSPDGVTWTAARVGGVLAGPGDQRIEGLTVFGGRVLGVGGFVGDHAEQPVLWRPPLP
ncbi:hypothetical protein [Thermomonospora umbrina]|uniref:DUF6242 domain-containing protein n=1 Tax=Thermomonospora umbrina TaxID=111806 RepID=A0A3D9SU90_9ACTN|nr:hypothetical protein [Thermomonospora umbrina]REE96555.1 hypothetical protein DFJ69_1992 [Thermomonospora umbrina]